MAMSQGWTLKPPVTWVNATAGAAMDREDANTRMTPLTSVYHYMIAYRGACDTLL